MTNDPDREFLLNGINNGFNIVDRNAADNLKEVHMNNYKSTELYKKEVDNQIRTEMLEGRYKVCVKRPKLVSALGAIPKKDGGIRLIHDCSRPVGSAVNDYCTKVQKCSFECIKNAERLIQFGYYMAKIDLKSAYRSVKIDSESQQFTGMKWCFNADQEPTYLVDERLPFGSKASPSIFHRITQAVKRIMQERFGTKLVVFLDDFLIISPSKEDCNIHMSRLISLLRSLGFSINWSKVCPPSTKMVFLGIEIDSCTMQLKLPADKVQEYCAYLVSFLQKTCASKRQLQSVAGKLNFAAQVVRGGRCYLRRLLTAINYLKQGHHKSKINAGIKADIQWWLDCIKVFNCRNILPTGNNIHVVRVDASGTGCGFQFGGDWGYVNWELDFPQGTRLHINYKEVMSVLFATRRWGPNWQDSKVLIGTDSMVAKSVLNKGTCKNPLVHAAVQEIFWYSVMYNFTIESFHVPGIMNKVPDAISRLHSKSYVLQLFNLAQYYYIDIFPLNVHMSYKSLYFLLQRWRRHWMQK